MKFTPLFLEGAYLIELEPRVDERGYFARTFCMHEFEKYGLITQFAQMSTSFNHKKGQIRGMHYQEAPHGETKIVRCTRGAIYDVMLDIRPKSPTYMQSYGTILTPNNGKMFYIPKGFAHGFKTLEDNTEIFYMMDEFYKPEAAREIDIGHFFDDIS
jgi:dTDP-4-dehydrorhamnose 3,5-epimerase